MAQNSAEESLELRQITPGDATEVAALHAGSFHRSWSPAEVRALLRGGNIGVIAFLAGEAVGFLLALAIPPDAEIISLAVRHDFRQRGLAKSMLVAVEDEIVARRCDKIFLEVAETNNAALKLYAGNDFKQVGKRPAYYRASDGNRTTALLLQKNIFYEIDI